MLYACKRFLDYFTINKIIESNLVSFKIRYQDTFCLNFIKFYNFSKRFI